MWKHFPWNAVFSKWRTVISVGLEVLTAVVKDTCIFLVISPLKANRRFIRTCRLRLQGWGINQPRKQHASSSEQSLLFDSEDGGYMSVDFERTTRRYIPEVITLEPVISLGFYFPILVVCYGFKFWHNSNKDPSLDIVVSHCNPIHTATAIFIIPMSTLSADLCIQKSVSVHLLDSPSKFYL
jgi:hypothetical protein